jgi:hypothetical protein
MKTRHSMTTLAAAAVLALVACSGAKRASEDSQRTSSADGVGTADQPNGCGTYVGDAERPPYHGGGEAVFTGHLSEGSKLQNGRFDAPFTPRGDLWTAHSCDTPNPKSSSTDFGRDVRYDELFFKNWTDADACISLFAVWDDFSHVAGTLQFAAYIGGFDPGNIELHNVGVGGGANPPDTGLDGVAHYAFKVPAHTDFEIVASAEAPYTSDGTKTGDVDISWKVQISNCGEPEAGGGTSSGGTSSSSSSGSSDDDGGTGTGTGKTW